MPMSAKPGYLSYQEICHIIGPTGQLTEAGLAKMKYLKAVQLESQRLLPSVWGTARQFDKDITISGYNIPAGTMVTRGEIARPSRDIRGSFHAGKPSLCHKEPLKGNKCPY